MFNSAKIELKSDDEIRQMRKSALVVASIHKALDAAIAPGMTTGELDDIARDVLQSHGAKSNFFGYYDYPRQTCISVNDTIVHGIPGEQVLQAGDIVSMDCGAVLNGWHADACFTRVLPGGDDAVRERREKLSAITKEAMWRGIAAMATGKYVSDIGNAIDDYIVSLDADIRPDIVEDFIGHGIGTKMHMEPDVLNFRTSRKGSKLKAGMVLCIEPILAQKSQAYRTLSDGWTVVTLDGGDACHWEHQVALHPGGVWVLSADDGGAAELARYGIDVVPLD
ncbi:methionyl aminopeptidase [Arcanobacterium pluranimalium]|uniref:type I methionyl aminopeptidase n=1 Tax=Arcanobacterium pluranimalium TaxID=108028 RepID=UPI001957E8D7|nr:type I methionyl aminopeptidase [Arcanobacterium pluranimalium]MBM7824953.1 methionyl aminopeptidase [Arcanobacterium pluranimalium]